MVANNNSPNVPTFNGNDYQFWSIKMQTLFKSQELWGLVGNGQVEFAYPKQAPRLTAKQWNELREKKKKTHRLCSLFNKE